MNVIEAGHIYALQRIDDVGGPFDLRAIDVREPRRRNGTRGHSDPRSVAGPDRPYSTLRPLFAVG